MRTALTGALVAAALAILAALLPLAASAQDPGTGGVTTPTPTPTETPTPTPTPTPDPDPRTDEEKAQDAQDRKAKPVKRVYRDYTRDGLVRGCDHTVKALRKSLRSIDPTYDEDFPDFRQAVEAAIKAHGKKRCEKLKAAAEKKQREAAARNAPAPITPSAPPPPPPPRPAPAPQSGALPGLGQSGGTGGRIKPLPKAVAPPAATPSAPPTAAQPPAAAPLPPTLVVTRASANPDLFVPGAMLAVALLGLLFAGLSALGAKRSGRLAGVGHAWREAAWRSSGTWADFTDWLRAGR